MLNEKQRFKILQFLALIITTSIFVIVQRLTSEKPMDTAFSIFLTIIIAILWVFISGSLLSIFAKVHGIDLSGKPKEEQTDKSE